MTKQFLLLSFFLLFFYLLKAQTVSISANGKKISFIITNKTTKGEIQKAQSIFSAHGITASIHASWKADTINKLNITVNCTQGNSTYKTDNVDVLQKSVTILVDQSTNATVPLCLGVCKMK